MEEGGEKIYRRTVGHGHRYMHQLTTFVNCKYCKWHIGTNSLESGTANCRGSPPSGSQGQSPSRGWSWIVELWGYAWGVQKLPHACS